MATSTVDEPKLPGGYLVTPRVPQGLAAAVEGLTREVLRHSPEDIYVFAAHHFEKLLHIREQCGGTERVSEKNSNVRALREMSKALKMREVDRGNAKAMKNAVHDQVGWSLNQTARVLKRHRSIFGDAGRRISTDEVFRMAKQKENRESSSKLSAEKGERRNDRPTIEKTSDESAENVWKASTSRTERSEDSGDTNEMNSEPRSGPRIITQIPSLQSGTGMLAKDIKTELRKNRISSRERRSVRAKPEARSTVDRSGKNSSSKNSSERRTKGIETEIEKKRSSNGSSDSTRSSKDRQRTNGSQNSDDKAKERAIGMERVKDYVVQRFATTKSLEELQSANYVEKVQEIIDETGPIIKGKVDELKSGMIGKSKRSSWFADPSNATNKPSNGSQLNSDNRRSDENQSELKSRLTETQCLLENVSSCLTRPHRRSRSARSSRRSKSSAATHEDLSNSTITDPSNRPTGLETRLSKTRNLLEDISSTLSKPMRRSCSAKTLRKYDDGTSDDSGEVPITRFDETGKLLEGLSAPFVVSSHRLGSAKGSRIAANNDESSHSDSQSVSNVSLPAVRSISVKSSSGSVSRSVSDNLILPAISPEAPKSAKIKEDLVLPILSPPGTASSTIEDSKISGSKTTDVAHEETDIPEIPVEEYISEALVDDVFRDSLNVTPNFDGIPQRPDSLEPQETPEESREIASKIDDSEERLQENLEIAENFEDVDVSDIKNKLKELEEAERRIDRILDKESRNEAKDSADSEREIDIPIADEPTVAEESNGNKELASDRLSVISPEFLDCTYVLSEGSPHDIPDTVTTVIIPERPIESPQSNVDVDVQLKTDSPQEESSSPPESAKSSKKSTEEIEAADSKESETVSSAHREDLEETMKTIDESSENAKESNEQPISSPKLGSLSPPESAKSSKKSTEKIETADSNGSEIVSSAPPEDLEETAKTIDESSENAKESNEQPISSPKMGSFSPPESAKSSKKSTEKIETADSNESEIVSSAHREDLEETTKMIDESSQNASGSNEQPISSPKMGSLSPPESAKRSKKSTEKIETADSNGSEIVPSAHREDLEETTKMIDESSQNASGSNEQPISSPKMGSLSPPESAKSSKKSIEKIETADSNGSEIVSSAHREDLEETMKTIDESSQKANEPIEQPISSPAMRSLSPPESAKSSKKSTEKIETADSNESETTKTIDESSQNANEPIEQPISSPAMRSPSPPESAESSKKSTEKIETADSNGSEILPSAPPEDLEETAKTIDESSQNANVSNKQRIPSPKMQTELFGELIEPDITEGTSPVMNINYIRGMENRHDIQIAHQDLGRINEEMFEELEDLRERDDPSKETERIDGTEKISDETLKQTAERNDADDDDDGKEKINVEAVVDGSKEITESDLSPMALRTELDSESSNEAKESSAADEPLEPSAKCGISLEDEEDASSETRTPESSNEVKETTLTDGLSLSLDPTRPYVPELNLDSLQELTVSSFKMTEDEYENQCKVESENTNSITETLTSDENNRTNDNAEFVEYPVSSSERSKFHENSSREEVVEEPIVESRIEVKEDLCKKSKAYTMGTDDEEEKNPTDETVTIRSAEKESQESPVDNDETKLLRSPEEGKGESSQISEVSEETLEKQVANDEPKITEIDRKSRSEGEEREEQNLQISSENIEALRDGNSEAEEKNDEEESPIKIEAKALEIDDKEDKSSLEDDGEKKTEKKESAVDTPAESGDMRDDSKSEDAKFESLKAEIKREETKEDESGSLEISVDRPEVQTTIENTSEEGGNDESFVEEETPLAVSRSASQCTTRRVSSGNLTRLREDLSAGWSEQIGPEVDDEKDQFTKMKFSKIAGETIREQGSENDGSIAKDSKEYHIYVPEVDAGEDYSATESSSTVESAVTKIQARVRGFLTRRRLHRGQQNRSSTLNSIPSIQDSVAVEEVDKENDNNGLANAATTIQANYRRYKARNRLRREDAVHRTTLSLEKSFAESGLRHTGEFHDCIPLPIHDLRLQKGSSIVTTDGPSGSDKISESDKISINPHEDEIPSANNEQPVDSDRNDSEAKLGKMFFGQSANVPIIQIDMSRKISQLVDLVVLAKEEAALQSGYLNFITSVEDADPVEHSAAVPIDTTHFSGEQNNSNESTKEPLALSDTPLGVVIEEVTSSGAENFMKSEEPEVATESVASLSSPKIGEAEKKSDDSVENSENFENPEENRVVSSDEKKIDENLVLPTKSTIDLSTLSENFSFADEKGFLGPESSVDSMECPPMRKEEKNSSRSSDDRASQETPTSDRKIEKLETSPSDADEPSSALSFSMKAEDLLGIDSEETSKPRGGKTILEVTLTSGDLMKSKSQSQESQLAGERIESPITMVQMTPGRSESLQRDDLSEGACDDDVETNEKKKPQTSAKSET